MIYIKLSIAFLTHFIPLIPTPWNHQETSGFLMFSGTLERNHWYEQWYELGWYTHPFSTLFLNIAIDIQWILISNYQDCINSVCTCGLEIKTTTHYLLHSFHCTLLPSARQSINESILKKHDKLITKALLYGDDKFDLSCFKSIISSTIEFIVSTKGFSNWLV